MSPETAKEGMLLIFGTEIIAIQRKIKYNKVLY